MCGITGIIAFTEEGKKHLNSIEDAVNSLHHRGPDGHGIFLLDNIALGHSRLAIIDTTNAAAQPFTSNDGRYTIVFNGEIFNYRLLRDYLELKGHKFRSNSDTEVLLEMFILEGTSCLNKLNGFFAFAIFDRETNTITLGRDRYGEKPLYLHFSERLLVFGSEVKSIIPFLQSGTLNYESLKEYLHLNYTGNGNTLLNEVEQLAPGQIIHFSTTNSCEPKKETWYDQSVHFKSNSKDSYEKARKRVRELLSIAVQRRLISDVPIGSFLSGGVDSSIVSAIAAREKSDLETFSVGYVDEPYFDETAYARLVAKHIGTKHHVFSVTNSDLLESLHSFLNNLDDPFADSSALAVNILAKHTRKHVTAAISGDGADELFAGYNKHAAEFLIRNPGWKEKMISEARFLWKIFPASRNNILGNTIRQLRKFSSGMKLSPDNRYWQWAGFTRPEDALKLLLHAGESYDHSKITAAISSVGDRGINDVLRTDFKLVLANDMLVKVDRMSMLNSLEIRSPFLDHELVEYVMSLPSEYKITRQNRKIILKEAFSDMLPSEIFHRRKQGFEVPLLKWFKQDLSGMIDQLLDEKFLKEQRLFNPEEVKNVRKQLHSANPGDSAARIWGLIVFQSWWRKYLG